MAEVSTAPIAKSTSKAAAKAGKQKPSVQAKPETTTAYEKQVQPFLISAPSISTQSDHRNSLALSGLWKNSVQTKLKVGQPGDKYEQEADAIADKVVSSPGLKTSEQPEETSNQNSAIRLSKAPEEELQPLMQDEPEVQESSGELQARPEEEPEIQAMSDETDEIGEIQTKNGDATVSSGFESKLSEAKSGGSPLPQSTISKVEPHVNADLSSVRVHTDNKAVELNQSLGSQAFANQNHIFFNEGKYNPGTTSGDHLIAHEATHTVQQGASVKKKPIEEETPEEVQMKEDKPASNNQQAAAPPATPPPPSDAAPNANSGNAANDTGPSDQPDQGNLDNSGPGTGSNSTTQSPPMANTSGDKNPVQPKEDLQKENPITQRAAGYKEEEVAQVKTLSMEGNSEQAMASFTGAGASQVAMAFPTMGDTLNQKLGSEKQQAAKESPKLTAGTTGVKDQKTKKAVDPGSGKSADLKDGVTESEPAAQQLEPHQEGTPLPTHRPDTRLDEGKPVKEESGGFFSWLFDKFKNIMGAVKTVDQGLNTKAGASPKIDTKGRANPDRAENQSQEGKNQVNQEKQNAAREINNNPGQQNVQPLFFEEPKEVIIDVTVQNTMATAEDQAMADFVHLPLPESVRTQTDLDLAPKMEKSLAKPRQDTQVAAQKRDTDKQAAIKEKQAEAEKMNKAAEKEQQDLVTQNREAIAAEQKRGVDEAETQMNAFSTEADKEKAKANKEVKTRIKKDQDEGEKKLKAAESEAATKKKEGEAEAKAEKEAAKKNSKKKSWWGKFKDAVSSAVSWVTEKIGQIFDKIRKAVKFIIDKAKKAALALIEAGRKWIIDKLDKFGNWLKEKANKYLKHFPALRKRVNAFIDKTVDGAKKLVNKVADGLKKGVEALADALGKAINSVLNAFEGVLKAAVQFAGAMLKGDFAEALKIAFMATCKVAGIDPNPILNFINKAGETISLIFKNPAAFFSNVAGGVKLGINQFVKNIKKHLISGLISWLTGAMSDVPIQMPQKFDLKGIFSLVMQILGLTYDRIRAKVVKRIGPKGEQVVSGMEKTFQFVKDLITKGPIVIWERIKDKFNEIKEMAMDKIRNLVTIEVVKAGIKWIIGLLNPASAIVKAVLMLYDFVMFLIERKDQIIGFVTAVFDTVGPLARGQIKKAGNAVEGAMGRGVPVILGLLANLAGLGGIGKSVSKVIKTIQKPVDKVVDPVIGWLVKQGKKLYGKGKGVYDKGKKKLKDLKNRVLGWWKTKKGFKGKDGKAHTVSFKGSRKKPRIIVQSDPTDLEIWIRDNKATAGPEMTTLITKFEELRDDIKNSEDAYTKIEKTDPAQKNVNINNVTNTQTELEATMLEMTKYLPESFFGGDKRVPPSALTFKMANGNPTQVLAKPLTKLSGNTKGGESTATASDQDPLGMGIASIYTTKGQEANREIKSLKAQLKSEIGDDERVDLEAALKEATAKAIQFQQINRTHLVSHQLHGPPKRWNYAMTDNNVNGKMRLIEHKALEYINPPEGKTPGILEYKPLVTYHAADPNSTIAIENFPSSLKVEVKWAAMNENNLTFSSGTPPKEYQNIPSLFAGLNETGLFKPSTALDTTQIVNAIKVRISQYNDKKPWIRSWNRAKKNLYLHKSTSVLSTTDVGSLESHFSSLDWYSIKRTGKTLLAVFELIGGDDFDTTDDSQKTQDNIAALSKLNSQWRTPIRNLIGLGLIQGNANGTFSLTPEGDRISRAIKEQYKTSSAVPELG